MRSFPSTDTISSRVGRRLREKKAVVWRKHHRSIRAMRSRDEPRGFTDEERVADYWEKWFAFIEFHRLVEETYEEVIADIDTELSGGTPTSRKPRVKNASRSRAAKARIMARRLIDRCDIPQPRLRRLFIRMLRAEEKLRADQNQ